MAEQIFGSKSSQYSALQIQWLQMTLDVKWNQFIICTTFLVVVQIVAQLENTLAHPSAFVNSKS